MWCFYHQRAVQRIVQGVCSEYSFGIVTIVFNINRAELSWVARQRLGDGKISPSEVQQRCDIAALDRNSPRLTMYHFYCTFKCRALCVSLSTLESKLVKMSHLHSTRLAYLEGDPAKGEVLK